MCVGGCLPPPPTPPPGRRVRAYTDARACTCARKGETGEEVGVVEAFIAQGPEGGFGGMRPV